MSFSVILPTLNEKGHILKLIEEISNIFETNKIDYEIIVVDDNSDDGTYEIVENFKKNNAYVKTILRKNKKKSLPSSLNDGISLSKYENLIWMDADFQHPPKYIKKFIEKSKNFDVIISSRFLEGSERYFNNNVLNVQHSTELSINYLINNNSFFPNKLLSNLLTFSNDIYSFGSTS